LPHDKSGSFVAPRSISAASCTYGGEMNHVTASTRLHHAHRASSPTGDSDRADSLIHAMAALPADHPSRPRARERAIAAWLPLARHLAQRYAGRGEPLDDLIQVATLGLIKAIDRFDPDRGVDFVGFAIPTVAGEIKRHFRDHTWAIRVPRRLQELRIAISGAHTALNQTLGRSPTVADVAAHLGISEDEVVEGLEGARAYSATSLSAPAAGDSDREMGDTLGGDDPEFALRELRIALGPAIASLDDRERTIILLRFYGNLTQTEIAEKFGLSQMHISRLLTRSLAKLRVQLSDTAP
jgi:RNA polymerase sigma-B factor